MPASMRPYIYLMRLDRPIGIWLLLLPCFWSITLASGGYQGLTLHSFYMLVLFTIGSIIMRGAGCVINDLWDRNLDKMVERTKSRPIASGAISTKQGVVFFATLLLSGFFILLQMNTLTIILGFLAVPLVIAYPLMKRITWWPQAFLGITFNFGALMGWSAITGDISAAPIALYISGFFWTLAYDTIYAHQDIDDDVMAGIKSTARLFKNQSKIWVSIFQAACILCLFFSLNSKHSALSDISIISSMIIAGAALYSFYLIRSWDKNSPLSSLQTFKSNYLLGLLFLAAILFS